MMNYQWKRQDYARILPKLKKALATYEKKHGTVDFKVQRNNAFKKNGDETAQFLLGLLCALGANGVTQHFTCAYMWFNLAHTNGYIDKKNFRDWMLRQLSVTQEREAQNWANQIQCGTKYEGCC